MQRIINIFLSATLLVALILTGTGYYKCYSQDTVHLYGACCSEKVVDETCSSTQVNSEDANLSGVCCDKVDVQSLDQQSESLSKVLEVKESFFEPADSFLAPVKTLEKVYLHSSPSKSPPPICLSETYKVNCSFLC